MKLQFDENHNVEDFTFVLSNRGLEHHGEIGNIKRDSVNCKCNMNAADEISFEVYKTLDYVDEKLWDDIIDLKLVFVKELNEYFEITVSLDDSVAPVKTITGKSLCESELSQVNLYNIEINTELDIERDAYNAKEATVFYNPSNPKASLLHRILDKVPHYSIKYVDGSLHKLQRSFSIDGTSIYDWMVGECAEQFDCLFLFDSTERSISVYDLYTVCNDCGHRGESFSQREDGDGENDKWKYDRKCPECKSDNLQYYGEDTTIYIDKENLTDSVKFDTDVGSIKNCFKLEAGDDDMTAAIRNINPNGTDYIYYISEEQKADMPQELADRLDEYDDEVEKYRLEYESIMEELYNVKDDILYYESGMMPKMEEVDDLSKIENPREGILYMYGSAVYVYNGSSLVRQDENADVYTSLVPHIGIVDAATEARKLTSYNLSPLGMSKVSESTKPATVESSLLNYAKVYVKTGYVKLEINDSSYTFKEDGKGTWTGNFKVTNYSNEEDFAYSSPITIDIKGGKEYQQEFLEQKIVKAISDDDDEEGSIFDVLSIEDLNQFKGALTLYGFNRLKSFSDAIEGALVILQQFEQADDDPERRKENCYDELYEPYYKKFEACQEEMNKRQDKIEELEKKEEELTKSKNDIQKALNLEAWLGEELYPIFCSYRREDKYSNSNYISDGYDTAKIFDNARKFMKKAEADLYKSATRQHTISSTLHNLMVIPEFQPIIDKFELGNWIRIGVDGDVYRLRLISYDINFSSIQTINVEFSDLTMQIDCISDVQSVLASAQNMSTNFSYVSKQAEKGEAVSKTFSEMQDVGLDSSLVQINSNVNQEVTYGKNGILARTYNDEIDNYDPEQLRITSNVISFTEDNWKTAKMSLGKHDYYEFVEGGSTYGLRNRSVTPSVTKTKKTAYGLTSDFLLAGTVNGSQIIGGEIYSSNYKPGVGTYMDLEEGNFSFAGGKLTYGKDENDQYKLKVTGTIEGSHIKSDTLIEGNRIEGGTIKGATIDGNDIIGGTIEIGSVFKADANANTVEVHGAFHSEKGGTIGGFYIDDDAIYKNTNSLQSDVPGVYLGHKGFYNYENKDSYTRITGGKIETNNLEAKGGEIAGFKITKDAIYKGTDSLGSSTAGIYLGTEGIRQYGSDAAYVHIQDGILTAKGVDIDGTLKATKGKIGGFFIGGSYISSHENLSNTSSGTVSMTSSKFGRKIGNDSPTDLQFAIGGNFGVSSSGKLYANDAQISGTITTNNIDVKGGVIDLGNTRLTSDGNATIGGFTVDSDSFYNAATSTWNSTTGTTPDVFMCTGTPKVYQIAGQKLSGWCFGAGQTFGVTTEGKMYCTGGQIGGFKIDDKSLYNDLTSTWGSQTTPDIFLCAGGTPELLQIGDRVDRWYFGAGQNFGVAVDGRVYANDAYLSGEIHATEGGDIGGWTVKKGVIDGVTFGLTESYNGWYLASPKICIARNVSGSDVYQTVYLTGTGVFVTAEHYADDKAYAKNESSLTLMRGVTWLDIINHIKPV